MKLSELLTTARRFVDGVCAIPRFASMERLDEMREASRRATQIRSELGIDETGLIRQLAVEREAHAETMRHWGEEHENGVGLTEDIYALKSELSAARADLEALTRWRLQSEEPCPVPTFVEVSINSPRLGICLDRCGKLEALDSWRFTPESLAAWKAREGGGE